MKIRTIIEDSKNDDSPSFIYKMMEIFLGVNQQSRFLSPERKNDGRYITSAATLNKTADPIIFIETQLKRFFLWLTANPPVLRTFFRWLFFKKLKMKLAYFSNNEEKAPESMYKLGPEHSIEERVLDQFIIHNLWHACQLIQTEGLNILTDPVFGDIAPVIYPSMTKQFKLNITPAQLPKIDVICISHNHRDHVDEASLKLLIKRGHSPIVFTPVGDKYLFEKIGFKTVHEFEWHETISIYSSLTNRKITMTCTPADHRSGRYIHDTHRSLVSGWLINPVMRHEILYFAGDTARLNDDRMLSIALNIYNLYQQKKTDEKFVNIINLVPGGPNYTRQYMKYTHQSAMDSILVSFRLACLLGKINEKQRDFIMPEDWLNSMATVFMHHNTYQLGPDRFNENVFIYNRLLSYLEMDQDTLDKHLIKQQKKSVYSSLFHHRKDFIIEGIKELNILSEVIWPHLSSDLRKKQLIQFIKSRTHFPLLNEKITSSQVIRFDNYEESKIKPDTVKGYKK